MLDQNTDRMWYVIGAIVIGAAIIAMGLNIFSDSFDSVDDNFAGIMGVADGYIMNINGESPTEWFIFKEVSGGYEISGFSVDYINEELDGVQPTNIVIPANYNEKPVVQVGSSAFREKGLVSVRIPESVIRINMHAFGNNKVLSVINIPKNIEYIGVGSYEGNLLRSINIPKTVTFIGVGAFTNNLLEGDDAFIYGRNNDGSINTKYLASYGGINKHVIIPEGVEIIGNYAFNNSGLEDVVIPQSLRHIGLDSFSKNGRKRTSGNIISSGDFHGFWQVVDGVWVR